jgi:hypothetical protein
MNIIDIEKLKQLISRTDISGNDKVRWLTDFIDGRKLQLIQDEFYSEEEVLELLQKALTHKDDGEIGSLVTAQGQIRTANFFSWFEKFKNK